MGRTDLWSMRNQRGVPLWLAILALVLVAIRIGVVSGPEKHGEAAEASLVKWVSIEEAGRQAASSRKPILYDFSAAWCGPCRAMDKSVFNDQAIATRINDSFIPVRVVDRQQEDGHNSMQVDALQRRYRINAFPTIVIADASGAQKSRMDGFFGPQYFDRVLTQAIH